MKLLRTIRSINASLKVGLTTSLVYRASLVIGALSSLSPLIMLMVWTSVAAEGPVGAFGKTQFAAYFLAVYVTRQLTFSPAGSVISTEVRRGILSTRLLKPIHPVVAIGAEMLGTIPLRVALMIPVGMGALLWLGPGPFAQPVQRWGLFLLALIGGWLVTFLSQASIGLLSFRLESSHGLLLIWHGLFSVFSGYLFPLSLLPTWAERSVSMLPFRYQIGFPVEMVTGVQPTESMLRELGVQWTWVAVLLGMTMLLWRTGIRRFTALGG